MRVFTIVAVMAASLTAVPVSAQQIGVPLPGVYRDANPDSLSGISAIDGRTGDILSSTPSRLDRSREEMNRGRATTWTRRPTPSALRRYAREAIERGGIDCTVAETRLAAQLSDGTPLVEVACEEAGGIVIADTTPIQVVDCLDLVNGRGGLNPCRIPRNVANVTNPQ